MFHWHRFKRSKKNQQAQNSQQRAEQKPQKSKSSYSIPAPAYYVVQPNTMFLQQWPQVAVQDGYYPSSGFRNAALTFGAGLLLGELLF